ncbi:MAG: hypothetical protein SVR81_05890 [Chloroflexota bacterium]|nr:hypothetical protein [Chloroflexota bacterium]
MTALTFLLWLPLGILTAYGFLLMQRWSVNHLSTDKPKRSTWLVVGGSFIRWGLFSGLMLLAVRHALADLLVLLASFMITRTLVLFLWQKSSSPLSITTKHAKDKS